MQKCKPLFESMGPKLFVVGEKPSMANVVKLSGNFLIATVLESLGEALGQQTRLVASKVTVVVLENTGHWVLEERPKDTTEALEKFL